MPRQSEKCAVLRAPYRRTSPRPEGGEGVGAYPYAGEAMKRETYSSNTSKNPYPVASRSSLRYSASCDWGAKGERLGESPFEHPDGEPASPNSKIEPLTILGYAGVEGVWGRRGG